MQMQYVKCVVVKKHTTYFCIHVCVWIRCWVVAADISSWIEMKKMFMCVLLLGQYSDYL